MGKAQRTRQAITIRFDESDTELVHWLGQFAKSHTMTKVVKLACYLLSGIQPEEGLLALLPEVQQTIPIPVQEIPIPASREETSDALAAVMQELSALREELTQQRTTSAPPDNTRRPAPPPTLPEQSWPAANPEPVPVASSGLDLSGPRRKRTSPPPPVAHTPPTEFVFDPEECRRKLLDSIHAYGKEFQRKR